MRRGGKTLTFIISSIVNSLIALTVSWLLSYFFNMNIKNVLFAVGITIIIIIVCSSISGDSMGLSMQSIGNDLNTQSASNVNLKVSSREVKDKKPEVDIKILANSLSLIVAAIVCFVVSYFI